jgi:hypothetical protein
MIHRTGRIGLKLGSMFVAPFCVAIFLWTAAYPFSRVFRLMPVNYNEGWNVYNAQRVAEHQPLYPSTYGWTTVNYPALSFHLIAGLAKPTSDYLFAGRILSLAGLCLSGLFAGLIVWHTTRSKLATWLSGLFLVAIFCANASGYVGMDDPQMLAQAFFLAGLYVYLRGKGRGGALELTALLFVVGGNIKHSLIEFPLAVLLDLLLTSPRRALRFAFGGALMVALSVVVTKQIDGSAYVSCLLTPRDYSPLRALRKSYDVLIPILLPVGAAFFMARFCWKKPAQRVLALLLFCALAVNVFFIGGSGVTINGMFGSILAIVLLTGVFWAEYSGLPLGKFRLLSPPAVCAIFFLWLTLPMFINGEPLAISNHWRTDQAIERNRVEEQRFATEVEYLRQQPGPALCEDILHCYYAGKPYVYDPFNATRFIRQGKLDANVMVEGLRNREFGAVEMYGRVEQRLDGRGRDHRFAAPILLAIQQYYRPGLENEDGVIYIPREPEPQMLPKQAAEH